MVFSASRFRRISRGVPKLAIAGIAAILLGLPSAAGATFLRPSGISPGDSFGGGSSGFGSDNVALRAFRADFAEFALHDLALVSPGLPPFPDGFAHDFSRKTRRGGHGATFYGLTTPPWLDAILGGKPDQFAAALHLRPFCPIKPPPEVPEPGTAVLLAGGLILLSFVGRKRRTGGAAQSVS